MIINNSVLLISIAIFLLAAGMAIMFIFIIVSQKRKEKKEAMEIRIVNTYERLVCFQMDHPEVLSLSRKWSAEKLSQVYQQDTEEARQWAVYYSYVELGIQYCSMAVYAWKQKQIDNALYHNQHKPLIESLLKDHQLIIDDLERRGTGISHLIKQIKNKE